MRILSGVQSSGQLHLGNYYGALRQCIALQDEGEALYFIANYHALNTVKDPQLARKLTLDNALAFLALGLDPGRAILFRQSDIRELGELYWILGTVVPISNLERGHSYKDKIARGQSPNLGLFAYPVLMAVDILMYDTDVVPVGKDQAQHLEFARDWAVKFNLQYVPGFDAADPTGAKSGRPGLFKLPQTRINEDTALVPGIDGQKMSRSYNNAIELFGSDAEVKKRIMSIKTDSTAVDAPKPTTDAPLYDLLKVVLPPAEFAPLDERWRSGGTGYGEFKKRLLEAFHVQFDPARRRFAELSRDPGEVERILTLGAERARALAAPVVQRVRTAVGL